MHDELHLIKYQNAFIYKIRSRINIGKNPKRLLKIYAETMGAKLYHYRKNDTK